MASLQHQLSRLDAPGPAQHYAIVAVLDAVATAPPAAAEPALRRCLCLPDRAAVCVAADKLLALVKAGTLDPSLASSALLTSLSVAEQATAAPLADALVALFSWQHHHAGRSAAPPPAAAAWPIHPLSKTLQASAFAGPAMVTGVCTFLASTAGHGQGLEGFDAALAAVSPFLSYVLLDGSIAAQHPHLPPALHSALVRLGCSLPTAPAAQLAILGALASLLPGARVRTAAQQETAAGFVGDVVDLAEACAEEPGTIG